MDKKRLFTQRILLYEFAGFSIIAILLWLDELLDVPHRLFGALKTPVNIPESVFESILVLVAGILTIFITSRLLNKINILEGFLPICSSCKKIRDEKEKWHQIEAYIAKRSNAIFSHGLCPECVKQLYGDQEWYRKTLSQHKSCLQTQEDQPI